MKNHRSILARLNRRIVFIVLCFWAAGCAAPAATGVPAPSTPDLLQAVMPTAVETATPQPTAPPSGTPTIRPTDTAAPTAPPLATLTATLLPVEATAETPLPSPTATEENVSQPVEAEAPGCPQGCASEQPGCSIKGNISSEGEKIYHLPGQNFYTKTEIDPSNGERWFCSEGEAVNNGWRKAKR